MSALKRMTNRRRHNRVVSALSGRLSRILQYKGCSSLCLSAASASGERERLRVSAPQAGPVAGVLNVLRTHSQPCHSDHSPYLGNSAKRYISLTLLGAVSLERDLSLVSAPRIHGPRETAARRSRCPNHRDRSGAPSDWSRIARSSTAIRPWSAAESSVTTGYARFFSSISVQSFAPRPLPSIEDT